MMNIKSKHTWSTLKLRYAKIPFSCKNNSRLGHFPHHAKLMQKQARTHSSTYSWLANLSSMQLSCKGKLRPCKDKPRLRHSSPCKLMLNKLRPHLCSLKLYLRQGNLSPCNSHAKARQNHTYLHVLIM